METETNDRCVKNAKANLQLTITDEGIKFTTEKNVMLVLESLTLPPSQHLHGNELVIKKSVLVKCVDSRHNILIN